jgi:hypothetical protein
MDNRHISVNELLQGACQRDPATAPPLARFVAAPCAKARFRKIQVFGEAAVMIAAGDQRRSTSGAARKRHKHT